jgi:hypothetical protein
MLHTVIRKADEFIVVSYVILSSYTHCRIRLCVLLEWMIKCMPNNQRQSKRALDDFILISLLISLYQERSCRSRNFTTFFPPLNHSTTCIFYIFATENHEVKLNWGVLHIENLTSIRNNSLLQKLIWMELHKPKQLELSTSTENIHTNHSNIQKWLSSPIYLNKHKQVEWYIRSK